MCSREQNGHFWGNWRKVLIQMEVAEPGKSLFSSIINYLHYRALGDSGVTNLAIGGACLIFGNGIVRLFWEVIIPNHCDKKLWLGHFRMTKTTFEMLCNEIGRLVSPVMLTHCAPVPKAKHIALALHTEFIL